jgi:trans-aconitate 3-methyltransferase
LTPFKRVIGVDPSANMVKQAQANLSPSIGTLEYIQSKSEDLSFLEDASVDFVMAG